MTAGDFGVYARRRWGMAGDWMWGLRFLRVFDL